MAVRRVDTLGCHPLVLMKKLAAIGGLEILKEEKHTHDGVDYPYHIVAKVKDGLYVEAKDELYKLGSTPEMLPSLIHETSGGGTPSPLEVDANSLKTARWPVRNALCIKSTEHKDLDVLGMSALYSGAPNLYNDSFYNRDNLLLLPQEISLLASKKVTYGKEENGWAPPADVVVGFDPIIHKEMPSGVSLGGSTSNVRTMELDGSFGYAMNIEAVKNVQLESLKINSSTPPTPRIFLAIGGERMPRLLVISGTVFRVSSQISGESLVMPSEWETLPCTPIIINNDAGLFFCYNAGSTYSGMVGAITIDTSKGNGIEGSFPAIYDSGVFCGVRATGGEKLHVLGSPANPAGTVTMQLFSPEVPIPVDSVSGGPVVTDLFAYNSEEIRGSVEGLLAARENLPVGSVGWLDGKRYRVHLPGRMLQIG